MPVARAEGADDDGVVRRVGNHVERGLEGRVRVEVDAKLPRLLAQNVEFDLDVAQSDENHVESSRQRGETREVPGHGRRKARQLLGRPPSGGLPGRFGVASEQLRGQVERLAALLLGRSCHEEARLDQPFERADHVLAPDAVRRAVRPDPVLDVARFGERFEQRDQIGPQHQPPLDDGMDGERAAVVEGQQVEVAGANQPLSDQRRRHEASPAGTRRLVAPRVSPTKLTHEAHRFRRKSIMPSYLTGVMNMHQAPLAARTRSIDSV